MSQTPAQDPSVSEPGVTEPSAGPTSPVTPTAPASPSTPGKRGGRAGKQDDPLRSSRTSGFYSAVIALGVVLVLLIIFIVQNTGNATVNFLVWSPRAPLAVLLLIAVAAGIFLTATASSLRLLQVRRRVKKERKAQH